MTSNAQEVSLGAPVGGTEQGEDSVLVGSILRVTCDLWRVACDVQLANSLHVEERLGAERAQKEHQSGFQ